jgi:hypothetical protein
LSKNTWAVSSGTGSLYVLTEGGFSARYDLHVDGALSPFLLYAAHAEDGAYRLLLARAVVHNASEAGRFKPRQTTFELLEVSLDVSATNGVDEAPGVLEPTWRLPGPDLPYYTVWAEGGWLVLAEEPFGEETQRPKPARRRHNARRGSRPRRMPSADLERASRRTWTTSQRERRKRRWRWQSRRRTPPSAGRRRRGA